MHIPTQLSLADLDSKGLLALEGFADVHTKEVSFVCSPLTNCNNLFFMSLRKHTNWFSSTCSFSGAPVWPFIKSTGPSPFYSPAVSLMWAVIYMPQDSLSWEIFSAGNYWKKCFLLLSQLRDFDLFQPPEHLDSSVCSLLTLEEWAAPWVEAHKHTEKR